MYISYGKSNNMYISYGKSGKIIKNLPCKSKPIIYNVSWCYNLRDAAALHHIRDINEIVKQKYVKKRLISGVLLPRGVIIYYQLILCLLNIHGDARVLYRQSVKLYSHYINSKKTEHILQLTYLTCYQGDFENDF